MDTRLLNTLWVGNDMKIRQIAIDAMFWLAFQMAAVFGLIVLLQAYEWWYGMGAVNELFK